MKRKSIFVVVVLMVCVALVGTVAAQSDGPNAPDVAVTTKFTQQGQIKRSGVLFTGNCDMRFTLWDIATGGVQLASYTPPTQIPVTDGVYAAEVDFGNYFKGDARWIQTEAKCADDVSYTAFPRVALNPAPYAIGLMPGAQTLGNIPGTAGIFRAVNLGAGAALVGLANSFTGATYGVLGNAFSPNGYAVLGYADGGATGVRGESDSTGAGVSGRSSAGIGVYGESPNSTAVQGNSINGAGVVGTSTAWVGVYGVSTDNAGVWGKSTNGFAGYFEGKVGITGGSDLAELFNVSEDETEPGTLMIIDADNPGQLTTSTSAYDTRVAGIVSGAGGVNPGLTLHQEGVMDGNTHVAIAGRVYVKATAINGAIEPGDLLTTSDVPGHTMKATDAGRSHGAIIGKAMTGLDSGTGLVLVLVNLQ